MMCIHANQMQFVDGAKNMICRIVDIGLWTERINDRQYI